MTESHFSIFAKLIGWNLLLLLLIICSSRGAAQDLAHRHYTIEDGLASNTIYAAYCDADGYMWFGSDRGIQRFDGYTFQTFFSDSKHRFNDVFEIFEDDRGRTWCSTLYGNYFQLVGDSIVPFKFNNIVQEYMNWGKEIKGFHQDTSGTFHLSIPGYGLLHIDSLGGVSKTQYAFATVVDTLGHLFYVDYDQSNKLRKPGYKTSIRFGQEATMRKRLTGTYGSYAYCLKTNEQDYISSYDNLYVWNKEGVSTTTFDHRIIDLYEAKDGAVWVTFQSGGVKRLDQSFPKSKLAFLSQVSVTKTMEDAQGGFWFTTENNGLYYIPSLNVTSWACSEENKRSEIISLDKYRGKVTATNEKAQVFIIGENHKMAIDFSKLGELNVKAPDVFIFNDTMYHSTSKRILNAHGTVHTSNRDIPVMFRKSMSDGLFGFDGARLYSLESANNFKELMLFSRPPKSNPNLDQIGVVEDVEDYQGGYLISANNGLFYLDSDSTLSQPDIHPALQTDLVRDILATEQYLFLATQNTGLIIKSGDSTFQISMEDGLPSATLTSLFNDGDSLLWIGTNNGISAVDLFDFSLKYSRNSRSGLVNDQVTEVLADSSHVYVGTMSGLTAIARSASMEAPLPILTAVDLKINNKPLGERNPAHLDHSENNLLFQFRSHGFQTKKKSFRYRLRNHEPDWNTTSSEQVNYTQLPSGNYTFEVQAGNDFNKWSAIQVIPIQIAQHWTRSLWFILLMAISAALIIWLIIRTVKRTTRIKMRQENLQNYYQQEAERSKMNPHFVFNSLNSLQYFVSANDNTSASKYLSSFSKLLRKNLESTGEDLLSLEDEVDLIESYCQLEFMRFEGIAEYAISVDPSLKKDKIYIPAMIIQPLVENAIWHGLLPLQEQGSLTIEIARLGNRLVINICDNGVGRKKQLKSLEAGKRKEKHAIHFIEKRLHLYSKMLKKDFHLTYADLNPNAVHPGTVCTLNIPIIKSKSILLNDQ